MSYLQFPRLHFSGRFVFDPSTVNNDPEHFDNDTFQPRFHRRSRFTEDGWWNPWGSASFRLLDCVVTSVVGADGRLVTSGGIEPVVGGSLVDDGDRVSAKIQDLDPVQQGASQIWGLRLRLSDSEQRQVLYGDFRHASFVDLWGRCRRATGLDKYSAVYQSVIRFSPDETDTGSSPFLKELVESTADDELSIKFMLDGYEADWDSPRFGTGRIVGSIGPTASGEPRHFTAARRLRRPAEGGPLMDAPCRIDGQDRLHIDLGNSVPTSAPGGPPLDSIGLIQVVALPKGAGEPEVLAQLGPLDAGFLTERAGIATIQLGQDRAAFSNRRLALRTLDGTVLLEENSDASFARADDSVFHVYPPVRAGEGPTTTIHATRFGEPADNVKIVFDNAAMEDAKRHSDDNSLVAPPIPMSERGGLQPIQPVTTDRRGQATVRLAATDPGNPRGYIDGQVYNVDYGPEYSSSGGTGMQKEGQLNVLVWEEYKEPADIAWIPDVKPILQQYANLYPVMREVLDLANYHDVVKYKRRLQHVLTEPVDSPSHMPVTRDLSPGKRDAIVGWLRQERPPFLALRNVDDLRHALQLALELEHSTIPPYLYALFSLKPGRNHEVAEIIRSVVMQEMLHITLVANILTALDGKPRIGRPGFVPTYPNHLPAGVLPDLVVSLRRCSIEQIRDVFMGIERPERPLTKARTPYPEPVVPERIELNERGEVTSYHYESPQNNTVKMAQAISAEDLDTHLFSPLRTFFQEAEFEEFTIGWLYTQIARKISEMGDGIFTGRDRPQVLNWPGGAPGNLHRVYDVATAHSAIYEIIYQGEGTIGHPEYQGQPSHYYRFQQVVRGRRLIQKDGAWVFEGEEIPFDPDGVYPVMDDPDTSAIPLDSPGRLPSEQCDRTYGDLLRALNRVFNGHPEHLQEAVSLMYSVEVRAKELFRHPSAPGADTVLGPSFQV
ncbi:ferritin-like domain-containing protein [Streptomyces cinerochromogenes]|uniref:ferritin-like domain-containing protein n=1 Tax=Streptomyces cinerochromogenes TaxID=66422 RepID=UPI00166FCBAD|nr:ferritin-like protein [Streptomyces cinerochromogenes]GGS89952.1 hypothetical protein GCM10010206_60880 [Streptomyces cinerochromogenes]